LFFFISTFSFSEGYDQGFEEGTGRSWNIQDPTYFEANDFVNADKTDEKIYYFTSRIVNLQIIRKS